MFYAAPDLFGVAKELWNFLGPYALLQKHSSEISDKDIELSKEILNFYCGPLEDLGYQHFENFTKMLTDSFFWFGTNRFLDLHMEQALGNTYFYRFKYYVLLPTHIQTVEYTILFRDNIITRRLLATITIQELLMRMNSIFNGLIWTMLNTLLTRKTLKSPSN